MTIPVRRSLIDALITRHFGSQRKLAIEWDYRIEVGLQHGTNAPDRKTIARQSGREVRDDLDENLVSRRW